LLIFIPLDDLPTGHLVDCAEHAPFGLFGELAQERSLTLIGLGNRFAPVPYRAGVILDVHGAAPFWQFFALQSRASIQADH
jgi:hypothetical protein